MLALGFRSGDRPPGSYPKAGVMSGLATILPEPGNEPVNACFALLAPIESVRPVGFCCCGSTRKARMSAAKIACCETRFI